MDEKLKDRTILKVSVGHKTGNSMSLLEEQLVKREQALGEKIDELDRIQKSRSWRLLLKIVYLKKCLFILIKKAIIFITLIFLLILSILANLYLGVLKKLRGTIIFPGN